MLEVSIFCMTALTALLKAHDISCLTFTYLKTKLFLNREVLVPQQLSVSIWRGWNQIDPILGHEMEVVKEPNPQMVLACWLPSGHHSVITNAVMRSTFSTVSFSFQCLTWSIVNVFVSCLLGLMTSLCIYVVFYQVSFSCIPFHVLCQTTSTTVCSHLSLSWYYKCIKFMWKISHFTSQLF